MNRNRMENPSVKRPEQLERMPAVPEYFGKPNRFWFGKISDSASCTVTVGMMDRVAGVGLSGAKETPEVWAIALQPRPPLNA